MEKMTFSSTPSFSEAGKKTILVSLCHILLRLTATDKLSGWNKSLLNKPKWN